MIKLLLAQRSTTQSHFNALLKLINLPKATLCKRIGISPDQLKLLLNDDELRHNATSFPIQFCLESLASSGGTSINRLPDSDKNIVNQNYLGFLSNQPYLENGDMAALLNATEPHFFNNISDNYPLQFLLEHLALDALLKGDPLIMAKDAYNAPLQCRLSGEYLWVAFIHNYDGAPFNKEIQSTFTVNPDKLSNIIDVFKFADLMVKQYVNKQTLVDFLKQQNNEKEYTLIVDLNDLNKNGIHKHGFYLKKKPNKQTVILHITPERATNPEAINSMAYHIAVQSILGSSL